MTDECRWLLERANESLKAADLMFRNKLFHSAVSEGYYAMFYSAQALILARGENASTHKGVLALFSKLYVKTGEVDRSFSAMISTAFSARGKADYEIGMDIPSDEAQRVIADAHQFYELALKWLSDGD